MIADPMLLPPRTGRPSLRAAIALLATMLLAATVLAAVPARAEASPAAGDRVAASAVIDRSAPGAGPAAEPLRWRLSSAGQVFDDPGAPGGSQAHLWSEGTATTTVSGQGQVVVHARADQCQGAPRMLVAVDGRTVGVLHVRNEPVHGWWSYRLGDFENPQGEHEVAVTFQHDWRTAGCDRNLHLGGVSFTPPPPQGSAQLWRLDGNGVVMLDLSTPGKAQAHLWSRGTATTTLSGSGILTVYAQAETCGGYYPWVQVLVDGWPVGTFTVRNLSDWWNYPVATPVAAGEHEVQVRYHSDMSDPGRCDLNLRVGGAAFSHAG